jgi:hypothetical protein
MSAPDPDQLCPPLKTQDSITCDTVSSAIEAIARGEFVVVMDEQGRENEGDLICAAEKITIEGMAWMIRWSRWVGWGFHTGESTERRGWRLTVAELSSPHPFLPLLPPVPIKCAPRTITICSHSAHPHGLITLPG